MQRQLERLARMLGKFMHMVACDEMMKVAKVTRKPPSVYIGP